MVLTKSFSKYIVFGGVSLGLLSMIVGSDAKRSSFNHAASADEKQLLVAIDTPETDDSETPLILPYNFNDQSTGDPLNYPNGGGLMLNNPSNINTNVEYDPTTGNYLINQTMGGLNYRPPTYMESEEYQDYMFNKQVRGYWNQRVHAESANDKNNTVIPKLRVGGEVFDRIFGGNTVDIRPNGSAELIFAYNGTKTKNPALPEKQQKVSTFDFNEKIQLNVVGKIGDKLKLTTSYNTEATFDFENQMKLEYTGYEDEIIKKIEAGNVSMPLNGSLITGSQTLFGVKTQLQFGRLTVTSILSQQKGKKSEVEVSGGAQVSKFEVNGDQYEERKHYFLAQYFRDSYNNALANLPFVNSGININRVEVWVSNTNAATNDVRFALGFTELGEDSTHVSADLSGFMNDAPGVLPDNAQNTLYSNLRDDSLVRGQSTAITRINFLSINTMKEQLNFELFNARKLQPSEYTFNPKLGYLSLNQQINTEQVLSVAFQYTYNGTVYQVGEFSDGGIGTNQLLYLKMLKSSNTSPTYYSTTAGARLQSPLWNLMMKNIYSIGSYQINPKDFKLDIYYNNGGASINYIPIEGCAGVSSKPLLQVLNMDKLNQQSDPTPDGVFDFLDGITINATNGRVIFSTIEPFGALLESKMSTCSGGLGFIFNELYDSTKTNAQTQFPSKNKYKLKGQYESSSSSEISLGAPNVPQGSVTVTAGGVQLTENVDYTVDYTLGRVKIVNEGILNSGTPIKISLESNALFAIQSKTLMGTHLDYRVNKDFNIGGTIMNLTERPLTKKVNIGDEPISNTIWGLDGNYRTEAPFLTRLVDKIPLIETKEMSTITAAGEFAYLIPGHSKAIGKDGNSYIDDFEGSQSTIDLRAQSAWSLASTPQGQTSAGMFPEGSFSDTTVYGFNRARLAWYVIDPIFLRQTSGYTPSNISNTMMSNNFMREIPETEVFPNKQSGSGQTNIATLDMAYYPSERGPYNYDATPTSVSAGLDANGNLNSPATRWGGIMRSITTNDFEAANIEYIQFWVMDPFNNDNINLPGALNSTGDLYFDIGNVSEDVLRDGYKSAENVLPAPSTASQSGGLGLPFVVTDWGNIPTSPSLVNAFNSEPNDRPFQDVGLDGLSSASEQTFFQTNFLSQLSGTALANIQGDPSADDFHYYRGDDYDDSGPAPATLNTLERYKKWNGMEKNSPTTSGSSYSKAATQTPNTEDINRDNNLSTVESYYQYRVSLKQSDFTAGVGNNYITDVYTTTGQSIKDGSTKPITWYQFKIPLKTDNKEVFGNIENFQSIRFIRMFFKNVDKPIILRFARLELVRGEWRKYGFDLMQPGFYQPDDDPNTQFDIGAVNIEENGNKQPVNYVLPPDIQREQNAASANIVALNEQSMSLTVCNLEDGKGKAAYKTTDLDVRSYKKLKMFVHAEASANTTEILNNNDLHLFVRLGTDYTDNYYEYEIPLQITPPGNYNGTNTDDQYKVWPASNEMILEFEKLQSAKQKRNIAMFNNTGGVTLTSEYHTSDGNRTITIKGNPNLSAIKTIMIGVKNPKKASGGDGDDGFTKCGQIWVNELRLTDFDQKGGWAANARVTAKLADFGNVSLSGNMYTPGFGSLENKVNERKRETLKQYDFSSSLELGKFIPEKFNVHVPMYVGYSEAFITPQYNPLDPDILLAPALKDASIPKDARDSLRHVTQDYTRRKGINFTNVKKNKGKGASKPHVYDVENWAASYAYNEQYKRNVNIEYNMMKNQRGGLMYNFSPKQKSIKPFAKTKIFQSRYLQIIKDINFSLTPSKFGFSTDVEREYDASKNRNTTGQDLLILPTYNKRFNMTRNYDFKYDITKGIKLDFTANNEERIREPDGEVTSATRDTLWREISERIKKTSYNHQVGISYNIPINKLPLLDFTTATARYAGTYRWMRAPFSADSLGNVIENSKSIQWNGQLNMVTLYNKIPYFKKINQKSNKGNSSKSAKTVSALKGKASKNPADSTKKDNPFEILEYVARVVMSLKNVTVSYVTTEGTKLPAYAQGTQLFGLDEHFAGPTTGFVIGSQKNIFDKAVDNNWLVKTQSLNSAYITSNSQKLDLRANIEPFPDLKMELTEMRTKAKSMSAFFRWNPTDSEFHKDDQTESGTFSMSFLAYKTSFVKDGETTFRKFLDARASVSARLGDENLNSTKSINGFAQGYNQLSADVMIPAFLAAYSGKNPNNVSLDPFPKIPKPNWRITYDGLSKIERFKKYFKSMTLSNAYRSTYNVGGYNSNLLYHEDINADATAFEAVSSISANPNFISKNQITTVTISEQWSPLAKLEVTLKNSISVNIEYKKDRNLSLGLTSQTITEVGGREITGGAGYRIRDVTIPGTSIKGKPIKSDLNLKVDISFRKNETVIRRIVEQVSQSTGGTNVISIKVSADYVINEKINIKAFYDRIINKPVISSSFPTTNTNAGISIRLALSN